MYVHEVSYEETPFFGESRIALLNSLLSKYHEMQKSCEPILVSLTAPPGWGKTRVARELYKEIAGVQSYPEYWPKTIWDPDQGRKAVRPAKFDRSPESKPDFCWWGIACSFRYGTPVNALCADRKQLDDHALFLTARSKELEERGWAHGEWINQALRAFTDESTQLLISQGLEAVASELVPLLGISKRTVRWLVASLASRREIRAAIVQSTTLGDSRDESFVDETVGIVSEWCRPRLPLVVLVEDVHEADEDLLDLLSKLLEQPIPAMIITTTLPDKIATNPRLARLLHVPNDRIESVNLSELPQLAKESIVRAYYPAIPADTLDVLTCKYDGPLALEMACQKLKERHIGDGSDVDASRAYKLPKKLYDLYRDIWGDLSDSIRVALAVAYVITPTNIASTETRVGHKIEDRWSQSTLADVIRHLDLRKPTPEEVLHDLDNAPYAYSWSRIAGDGLRAFAETMHREVVRVDGPHLLEDRLDADDQDAARRQVLSALAVVLSAGCHRPSEADAANCARTILALNAEGYLSDDQVVADAIGELLSHHYDGERRANSFLQPSLIVNAWSSGYSDAEFMDLWSDVVALYRVHKGLNWQAISSEVTISIHFDVIAILLFLVQSERGDRLRHHHDIDMVVDVFERLRDLQADVLGSEHSDTLATQEKLAYTLRVEAYWERAAAAYRVLISELSRIYGADNPKTFDAHLGLRECLMCADMPDETVQICQLLLTDFLNEYGPEHRRTRQVHVFLAEAFEGAKCYSEAADAYAEVLGPNHRRTLNARYGQAEDFKASGYVEVALDEYRAKLIQQIRSLGTDHKATRVTRHQIVRLLGGAGRFDEAVREFESLLDDRLRVVAPYGDGIDSGAALHDDATAGERLRTERSFESAKELWEACDALLGVRWPEFDRSQRHSVVSFWLTYGWETRGSDDQGPAAEAAVAYRELLAGQLASVGPEGKNMLLVRRSMAVCWGIAGSVDEAVDTYRELLDEQLRVLDEDHPDVLATRHSLARWHGIAGSVDEAVDTYRELLDEQLRVLDEDHPDVLATRRSLAGCLNRSDCVHRDDAASAAQALLDHRQRVLEADHPDILDARNNLTACLFRARRYDEAIIRGEELLQEQQRLLGAGRDYTELTRSILAVMRSGSLSE